MLIKNTIDLVKKTDYYTKTVDIKNKIPDFTETGYKTPDIIGLVSNTNLEQLKWFTWLKTKHLTLKI